MTGCVRRINKKCLNEYVSVGKRLTSYVTDTKVVKAMFKGTDHYAVLKKMKVDAQETGKTQ